MKINDKRGEHTEDEIIEAAVKAPEPIKIPDAPTDLNLKMLGERVLVQLFPKDDKIGSIIMLNEIEPNKYRGRVLSVGEEVSNVKPNDVVIVIIGYAPPTIKASNGESYAMLPSDAIVAIDTDFINAD